LNEEAAPVQNTYIVTDVTLFVGLHPDFFLQGLLFSASDRNHATMVCHGDGSSGTKKGCRIKKAASLNKR